MKYNILYIGIEQLNLPLFKKVFNPYYTIYTATSAKEAFIILEENAIHLIVSDHQITGMAGIEFMQEVKKKYPNLKSILLTDHFNNKAAKEAVTKEIIWRYVNKPYENDDLKVTMDKALEAYQLKMERDILHDELEFRREKLDKIIDTTIDAIITINDDQHIVMANKAAGKMFGYQIDELIGKPLTILIPEEKRKEHPKYVASFEKEKRNSKSMIMNTLVYGRSSKGEKIPIETNLSKQNINGKNYYTAFVRDISEKLNAEKEVRESEFRLREAQQIAKLGHWNLDLVNNKLYWSDEVYRIFEIEPQEFEATYEAFLNMIHPDDREMANKAHTDSLITKKPYEFNHRIKLKNGTIKYIHEKCVNEFDDQGKPLRSTGTVQDISARTKTEMALKESEEKFRTFTDSAKVAILVIKDMKPIYANKECEKLLGYTEEEFLNMGTFTGIIHPDNLQMVAKNYKNRLEGKEVTSRYETKVISRSGKTKDVDINVVFIELQGEPALLISFLDITKKNEITYELKKSVASLVNKNKELEQFAYIASHDLQEPLGTVSSFVELLHQEYQGELDDKANQYIRFIKESTERMRNLMKGLLEYSRIGQQKTTEMVDCNEILKAVLEDFQTDIYEKKAKIESKQLPKLQAYPIELKQLFQNLISNALKYSKQNAPLVINISAHQYNGGWQFEFKDNGIGIDEKFKEKIFVIFQRLHNKSEYRGTGIGLAHCRKIVEMHHGKIWVESAPNIGSEFCFTLKTK